MLDFPWPSLGWSAASPYALTLGLAALLCVVLAVAGLRRRTQPGSAPFALLMVAAALWALLYCLELATPALSGKVLWAKAEYLGITVMPLAWFLFARSYTGATKRLRRDLLVLICFVPALTVVLVATNEFHGLVWRDLSLSTSGPFLMLALVHGPWFWVHVAYSYGLLAVGSIVLVSAVVRYPRLYRRQGFMLMVGTAAPWVGNALSVFGLLPGGGVDLTPLAFAFTGVALLWAMSRFRLLSLLPAVLPTARNQALQKMKDGVLVLDVEGRLVNVNPAASEILGEPASRLIGTLVSELLGGQLISRQMGEEGLDSQFETCLGEGASRRNYDVVSSPLGLGRGIGVGRLLVLRDITERKQMEDALRESARRYRTLFDSANDGIVVHDLGGTILEANSVIAERLGCSHLELQNMTVQDIRTSETAAHFAQHMDRIHTSGSGVFETTHRGLGGDPVPVEESSRLIDYGERRVVLSISRDISERKQAEEALRESEGQLRQAQKMEAVGQLAGGIAHDFNNLLTTIIGDSSLALDAMDPADPNRELVADIHDAGERAAGLTKQILAFSRRQILKPQTLCLNDIVSGVEPLLRRTLGEDIDLQFSLAPDLAQTEVDPHQMEQVLINLAVNARDAMPEGGSLTVETVNTTLDRTYCRTHAEVGPGPCVTLAVTDTGCGMDQETASHIFEPFFTTKEVGKGTGLGLSTCFGIARQSGGSISVYSEPGQGTSFKVHLPVSKTSRANAVDYPQETEGLRGQETILVVEDEATVRALVVRVLSGAGYRVLEAGSASEADAVLREDVPVPDLLLTDVVLPGGASGREVAQSVLARFPGLGVVFMSGYTRDAVVHNGRLDEGIEFLEKPFAPEALLRNVRRVLDGETTEPPVLAATRAS